MSGITVSNPLHGTVYPQVTVVPTSDINRPDYSSQSKENNVKEIVRYALIAFIAVAVLGVVVVLSILFIQNGGNSSADEPPTPDDEGPYMQHRFSADVLQIDEWGETPMGKVYVDFSTSSLLLNSELCANDIEVNTDSCLSMESNCGSSGKVNDLKVHSSATFSEEKEVNGVTCKVYSRSSWVTQSWCITDEGWLLEYIADFIGLSSTIRLKNHKQINDDEPKLSMSYYCSSAPVATMPATWSAEAESGAIHAYDYLSHAVLRSKEFLLFLGRNCQIEETSCLQYLYNMHDLIDADVKEQLTLDDGTQCIELELSSSWPPKKYCVDKDTGFVHQICPDDESCIRYFNHQTVSPSSNYFHAHHQCSLV
ncbi:hypothetical protein P9112_014138 [Eukaryota sp. TZLM1-RC]